MLSSHSVRLHSPGPRVQQRSRSELSAGRLGWARGRPSAGRPSSPLVEVVIVPSRKYSVLPSPGKAPQLCWGVEVGSVGDGLRSPRCRWGPLISTCCLTSLPPGYSRWSWSCHVLCHSRAACPTPLSVQAAEPGSGRGPWAAGIQGASQGLLPLSTFCGCRRAGVILRTSLVCQDFCEKDGGPRQVASHLLCRTQSI